MKPKTIKQQAAQEVESVWHVGSRFKHKVIALVAAKLERIAELEAALAFYADEGNWYFRKEEVYHPRGRLPITEYTTNANGDRGDVARKALKDGEV